MEQVFLAHRAGICAAFWGLHGDASICREKWHGISNPINAFMKVSSSLLLLFLLGGGWGDTNHISVLKDLTGLRWILLGGAKWDAHMKESFPVLGGYVIQVRKDL